MGFKTEAKSLLRVGNVVSINVGALEYRGIVEKNSLISGDHNNVEFDSCIVLRSDKNCERYVIPLGIKSNCGIVLVIPFEK
jgi:hypothetical protein